MTNEDKNFCAGLIAGAIGATFSCMFLITTTISTPTPLTPSVTITITDGQADTLYTYREK